MAYHKSKKWVIGSGAVGVLLIVLLYLGYGFFVMTSQPARDHPFFTANDPPQRRPLAIAHRGGAGLWPENTMLAFERAAELGVDVLEMDMHSSRDGVLVVMHDRTVDRTTNGTGAINSFTLDELRTLDAGYDWSNDGGQTFPFRNRGITVPTLEEVFARFPNLRFNIEVKQPEPSLAAPLCQAIRQHNITNKVLIASFNDATIEEFRRECREVATSASSREARALVYMNKASVGVVYRPAAHAVQVPEFAIGMQVLTPDFVETAHHHNLQVHAWTINDEAGMRRMLDLKVDGIITDRPDRLLTLLAR